MLANRLVLGIDIGGTDIKVAVSKGNRMCFFKEYDWNPSTFSEIDELITPILLLTKLMLINYQVSQAPEQYQTSQLQALRAAMNAKGKLDEIQEALELFDKEPHPLFDEIGLCFPDVEIRNLIVGGEVYKMRGVRERLQERYEQEFRKLTHLSYALRQYCTNPDHICLTNDGPMAAFTAATELSFSSDSQLLNNGVFAHTLGTELGSGWIDERGRIPEIPLEVYNFIIDLGSSPQRAYHPDDLRSINNFNTHIGGTLQKYASQSGVFRLAHQYFQKSNPTLYQRLIEAGFIIEGELDGKKALLVPSGKEDLRKPFLSYIMELTESAEYLECDQIFSDIGRFLAETSLEVEIILQPKTKDRFLFGRLVKEPRCFSLMQKTYRQHIPEGDLRVADSSLANSSLMKQLEQSDSYTVAQFAQAVGALYYANFTNRINIIEG